MSRRLLNRGQPVRTTTQAKVVSADVQYGYEQISNNLGKLLHSQGTVENATFATFAYWSAESLAAEVDRDGARERIGRKVYGWVAQGVLKEHASQIPINIVNGQADIYDEIGAALRALLKLPFDGLKRQSGETDDGLADRIETAWRNYVGTLEKMTNELTRNRAQRPNHTKIEGPDNLALARGIRPYFDVVIRGLNAVRATDSEGSPADFALRKTRAELILLGNLRLVAYEQRRIQPVLERNFAYLPEAIRARTIDHLQAAGRMSPKVANFSKIVNNMMDGGFEIMATRWVYSMALGGETIAFGRDLTLPGPASRTYRTFTDPRDQARYLPDSLFPRLLQQLTEPELIHEWRYRDRSDGAGSHTAVDDWLRYPERMSFLANLFRSRQQLTTLYPESPPPPSNLPSMADFIPLNSSPVPGRFTTRRSLTDLQQLLSPDAPVVEVDRMVVESTYDNGGPS